MRRRRFLTLIFLAAIVACQTNETATVVKPVVCPTSCDDGNVCTNDTCVEGKCVHENNAATCDDGNACTWDEHCSDGKCASKPVTCDTKPCTDVSCDAKTGCVWTNTKAACDDGDACTEGDVCQNGGCFGTYILCDDNNKCTDDLCSSKTGCVHAFNNKPCDDDNICTKGDICEGGACTFKLLVTCDDNNECTDDSCGKTGCVYTPNTAKCDDNNVCTQNDVCTGGTCVGSTKLNCDDNNVCTDDSCDPKPLQPGCVHTPKSPAIACDDYLPNTVDVCDEGACVHLLADKIPSSTCWGDTPAVYIPIPNTFWIWTTSEPNSKLKVKLEKIGWVAAYAFEVVKKDAFPPPGALTCRSLPCYKCYIPLVGTQSFVGVCGADGKGSGITTACPTE